MDGLLNFKIGFFFFINRGNHIACKERLFYFFLSKLNLFYFIFYLIIVSRTSGIMLNKSGERVALFLILKE